MIILWFKGQFQKFKIQSLRSQTVNVNISNIINFLYYLFFFCFIQRLTTPQANMDRNHQAPPSRTQTPRPSSFTPKWSTIAKRFGTPSTRASFIGIDAPFSPWAVSYECWNRAAHSTTRFAVRPTAKRSPDKGPAPHHHPSPAQPSPDQPSNPPAFCDTQFSMRSAYGDDFFLI